MRALVVLLVMLLLSGCAEDALVPCSENDGPAGALCREYRFDNGSPVGHWEYTYRGDSAIDIEVFNTAGRVVRTVTERYEGGLLRTVVQRSGDGRSVVSSHHYLSNDSLELIVHGGVDSTVCFTYDAEGRRSRIEVHHGPVRVRATEYRYFVDQDRLYRVHFYDGNDSLLRYWNHEYFLDGRVRIDVYTAEHRSVGHYVQDWSADGRLLSSRFTEPDQTISRKLNLTYDAVGRLTERSETGPYLNLRTVYMYH